MAVSYVHKSLGKGIEFSGIYDKKFKSNFASIRFITPLNNDTASCNTLLTTILGTSNSVLPSRTKLSEKLLCLYDSAINAFSYSAGDYQVCGLNVSFIGDNYTLGNEKISVEAVKILLDCVFKPDIQNDKFPEKYFNIRKQELIDAIQSEINDRRSYASVRAGSYVYQNEPASVSVNGTIEQAKKITQSDLCNAYKYLLKNAYVDISLGGDGQTDEAEKMIADAFLSLDRADVDKIDFNAPSALKSEPLEVSEQCDVNQCKMIMAFKTDSDDFYAQKLMSAVLGGTAFSKLFANVREKMSLCYYCYSGIVECKKVMSVDSGIERSNVEKAKKEILNQLEAVANGDFSDEMLENTKKALYNGFRSNYDSINALNSWYFTQRVRGDVHSPDQVNEIIKGISKERVVEAAKSFKLDTVYVLEPEVQ